MTGGNRVAGRLVWVGILAGLSVFVQPARGSDSTLLETVVSDDRRPSGLFGSSVAIDGDRMMVAADGSTFSPGSVHAFHRIAGAWVETQKIETDEVEEVGYATSIALDGDVLVVGAPQESDVAIFSGAAYVYRFDGAHWALEQRLVASDADAIDVFGSAVAVQDDTILVGAIGDDEQGGSVYVFGFDGSTWNELQKFNASDSAPRASFGDPIALEGNVAVIGSIGAAMFAGAVYVFRFDGSSWIEEQRIDPRGAEFGAFGTDVALSGDVALIGDTNDFDFAGAAYVFRYDGSSWNEEQRLESIRGVPFDDFGWAVAVEGEEAIVGARGESLPDGRAYVFRYDGSSWELRQELDASGTEPASGFGTDVAIDGGTYVVSAPYTANHGSAYVLGPDCRVGTVRFANGQPNDVLYVDGSTGGVDRVVQLSSSDLVSVTMQAPAAGGTGKFVLHADADLAGFSDPKLLPFDVGHSCLPFLSGSQAMPELVANNVGKTGLVGESHFFGIGMDDPDRATTELFFPTFPVGTRLTFQALVIDPASTSPKGASVSNAVTLEIVP